jgi:hypothetical protein
MARTVQEIQEEQNILAQKQADLKKQLQAETSSGKNFDSLLAERTKLRNQEAALRTELARTTNQSPATGVYQGQDPNTGLAIYTNPATGAQFRSNTEPSAAQKAAFEKTQTPASDPPPQSPATEPAAPSPLATPVAVPVNIQQPPVTQEPVPQLTTEQRESGFTPVTQQQTVELSPVVPGGDVNAGRVNVAPGVDLTADAPGSAGSTSETPAPQKTLTTAEIISGSPVLAPPTAKQQNPGDSLRGDFPTRDASPTPQQVIDQTSSNPLNPSAIEITRNNVLGAIINNPVSISSSVDAARRTAVNQTTRLTREQDDWRVRLQLAPSANYLYNVATKDDLLYPLKGTNGVIFPYTPVINSAYRANYDPADLTHVNFKQFYYRNSSVDDITIQAEFTAQDTTEANYMLAVIHFFRTVTKMFYGQDGKGGGPSAGTPPPLCYLSGYGHFQYSDHPLLISQFTYNLPNDVDYIRAGSTSQWAGQNISAYAPKPSAQASGGGALAKITSFLRRSSNNLNKGGISADPAWNSLSGPQATYVPTKLQINLTCLPVVTRNDISNNFSVEQYATGKLFKGGIW